jgi:polygalacturonase
VKAILKRSIFILIALTFFARGFTQTLPPRNLIAPEASITAFSVTLLWDKPTQYNNVKTYEVYKDGKWLASSTKTNYTATAMNTDETHVFSVKAKDSNGKLSAVSNTIKCTTKPKGKTINVVYFGAKGDGVTLNTKAIQKAIDACGKYGTVLIPEGKFLCGALYLKSDMTLRIAKNGVLKGSNKTSDYLPFYLNRFEGWEMETYASLINAGKLDREPNYHVKNLSIEGEGTISGAGSELGKAMIADSGIRSRGRLICIMNGQNINLQGLRIENSPCWTIHYIYSDNVVLHDLDINSTARNGDGIDPDSSTDSYIFNCSFSTGDDCIAIKSGKNPEGNIVNKPTKNIRITNCDFVKGHSLAVGSEMSGGVSDVFIQDCKIGNLLHVLQIKATKDRGGYVRNVTVRDCELLKITLYTALNYNNDGEAAPVLPQFSDMEFSNLDLTKANTKEPVIDINGFSDASHYTRNLIFKNIKLPENAQIRIKNCENLTFKNVRNSKGEKPVYNIIEFKNIEY